MTDETQDTANKLQSKPPGKPFKKGYDPRRNLRGVPAEAIAARKAIRRLGAELVHVKEKVWDPDTDGYIEVEYDITRWEAMIRLMFSSKAPKDREMLLKMGIPGLLKDEFEHTGKDGEPLIPKENVDNERFDRAISSLADAVREKIPGTDAQKGGDMAPAE